MTDGIDSTQFKITDLTGAGDMLLITMCVCVCVCLDLVPSVSLVPISMLFVRFLNDLLCLRIDPVLGQSVKWGLEVGVLFQRLALLGWCRLSGIC